MFNIMFCFFCFFWNSEIELTNRIAQQLQHTSTISQPSLSSGWPPIGAEYDITRCHFGQVAFHRRPMPAAERMEAR
jgi:hypothetical protein